ncbi:MAG TPA: amidase [Burkholderiaceae bacterium]
MTFSPCPPAYPDLLAARTAIRQGETTAGALLEQAIAAAAAPACRHAFVATDFPAARAAAAAARADAPLAGLAVSVKDLFDVAGQTTRAGSRLLAHAPPAPADCPAVQRLRAAGAAILGRTHMVEFAFAGVGTNPHDTTPPNVADGVVDRIPGGSSSGAGVSVAAGAAWIGLGTDTGGSIRIPAALQGLVGFKNTARRTPTAGVLPLAPTLDTVCAMTRSVRDAVVAHEVLAARPVTRTSAPLSAWRLAAVHTLMLDGMDPAVGRAWERSLQALRRAGARIDDIALPELTELAPMQAGGSIAAAEAYAWHREFLAHRMAEYDPRVASRMLRGAEMGAADYIALLQARADWAQRMGQRLADFDAVLSPTVPVVAPPMAPILVDDALYFQTNALLLRNPSVVNMLDGCAISIPCHANGELPVGLMLWHGALRDDAILNIALRAEQAMQENRGMSTTRMGP